jgi:RND family efflux transporter MFP subunit
MFKPLAFFILAAHALTCMGASALVEAPPKHFALDVKQQAALGVHIAPLQTAHSRILLANATVTAPPGKEMTVTAPYPGQVTRLLVGVGDRVKAHVKLAHFTSPMAGEARRQWQEAGLETDLAAAALRRDQALFDDGIIPAVRLQLSRVKQESAQALLKARRAELDASGLQFNGAAGQSSYATGLLNAPMAGIVTFVAVSVGQRVEAGTILFKLADASELQLDIELSAEKAGQLTIGDDVSIPMRQAKGKIIGVSRAVDSSQSAKARALITARGNLELGELLAVTLHPKLMPVTEPNALWQVPSRAISHWQGAAIIFVSQGNGFTAQSVKIISSNDDVSMIEAALPRNGSVAITGIASLRAMLQADK